MDTQVPLGGGVLVPRPVEEDVKGAHEPATAHDLDAHAEHGAAVHGRRIRVADLERGDASACAVGVALVMGGLLGATFFQ